MQLKTKPEPFCWLPQAWFTTHIIGSGSWWSWIKMVIVLRLEMVPLQFSPLVLLATKSLV